LDARLDYRFVLTRGEIKLGIAATNLFDHRNVIDRYFSLEANDTGRILVPVDATDFGFRLSVDLQARF